MSKSDNCLLQHPNSRVCIFGRLLEIGEEVQEGDYYASSGGTWELVPVWGFKVREFHIQKKIGYARKARPEDNLKCEQEGTQE